MGGKPCSKAPIVCTNLEAVSRATVPYTKAIKTISNYLFFMAQQEEEACKDAFLLRNKTPVYMSIFSGFGWALKSEDSSQSCFFRRCILGKVARPAITANVSADKSAGCTEHISASVRAALAGEDLRFSSSTSIAGSSHCTGKQEKAVQQQLCRRRYLGC